MRGNLTTALGERADEGLTAHLTRTGDLVSLLRRRVQIDERLDQITRKLKELDGASQEWTERQMLAAKRWLGSASPSAAASWRSWWGLVWSSTLGGMGGVLAMFGLLVSGGAAATKLRIQGNASEQLMTCHKQIRTLQSERKQISDERETLDAKLPPGGGALVSRLHAAEKELADLEKLVPLHGHSEAAKRDAHHARKKHREARDHHRDARSRWRRALKEAGLPENLSPKQIREYQQHTEKILARQSN